jgi:chromosome segregation ATPase
LDAQHAADREKALEALRAESRVELRILQASWDEEKNRLDREVRTLKRKIEELEREATSRKAEMEYRVQEEKRKSEMALESVRQELENVRQHSEETIEMFRSEHEQKIVEYESRLSAASDNRTSSMFQMREEVETEFTERMEQLRSMYMVEIESQAEKMEEEKAKANRTEVSLRQMLAETKAEVDELNSYYTQQGEEYETKINELLTRLQEQTTLAVKLQTEIDEYEWYEEEEEGGAGGGGGEEEEEKRTQTPRRPASRPSSTRPLEQHRIPDPEMARNESPAMNLRHATASIASLESTASYATATGQNECVNATAATPDSLQSFASNSSSPSQPEPPPRSSASNRRSWNPEADSPQPQHTYATHLRYLYL